ncbi:MAG: tetratricopeptide repeat protein [Bacteroidales bacterium]|nr:tetratricopeptide repeat protein [Bacteroidales bacterium]
MKRFGWGILVVLMQVPILLFGQDYKTNILLGEQYYADTKYDSAAMAYQKVLDEGYHSAELYYNLGNSFYKQNSIPSAILYYEKALKLDPANDDVLFNLKLANSRIQDKIDALPLLFFIRWYVGLYNMFSVDNWAKISLVLFSVFALFSLFYFLGKNIFIRKMGFYLGFVFLILSSASLFLTYKKHISQKEKAQAIVFSPSVTVKSSPNENGVDLFVIHEGSKLQVMDKVGAWCEIKIANGSIGWIEIKTIELI